MLIFVPQILHKFLSETRYFGKPVIFHMEKCVCVCVCVCVYSKSILIHNLNWIDHIYSTWNLLL